MVYCYKCGRRGHSSPNCWQSSFSNIRKGNKYYKEDSSDEDDSEEEGCYSSPVYCYSCGKKGHKSTECYALANKYNNNNNNYQSREIEKETVCNRCGRDNHTAESCYAKSTVEGRYLSASNIFTSPQMQFPPKRLK